MSTPKRLLSFRGFLYLALVGAGCLLLVLSSKQEAAPPKVTITEFSDFQCPYCKPAASVVEQVRQAYGDRVKLVLKQMPLPMHAQAFKAAQASVCAGAQDKFWEYHDLLFADQAGLDRNGLTAKAAKLQLDAKQFGSCLSSGKYKTPIQQDVQEGTSAGVNGTPGFFINGVFLNGVQPESALESLIKEQLAARP